MRQQLEARAADPELGQYTEMGHLFLSSGKCSLMLLPYEGLEHQFPGSRHFQSNFQSHKWRTPMQGCTQTTKNFSCWVKDGQMKFLQRSLLQPSGKEPEKGGSWAQGKVGGEAPRLQQQMRERPHASPGTFFNDTTPGL